MAGLVIGPLVSMVKEKASSYLLDKYKVMEGMEEQRKILERHLPAILYIILDAEEKAAFRPDVAVWLDDLKTAAYEANDIFDEFKYEALHREAKKKGHHRKVGTEIAKLLFPACNPIVFRYRMGKKLQRIVRTIEVVVNEMNKFDFRHLQQAKPSRKWRQTDSIIIDSDKNIVSRSRGQERKKILRELIDDASNMDLIVIPIVGPGGIGKTTFVQLVYNDPAVRKHFELRRWCCVADDFEVDTIASNICESETSEKGCEKNLQELQSLISGKRYLIVLDDVWNQDTDKWGKLKTCLKQGGKGSALLATTRDSKVAEIMIMGATESHKIEKLSDEHLREIVQSRAFNPQNQNSVELDDIFGKVVARCAGSPLAAKTFGSMLSNKTSMNEWKDILAKRNICDERSGILPILKLSFDDLPSHMKQCFAFCAIFPKNYEIDVDLLIQLWMAHDFIPAHDGDQLETVGAQIFMELAWRSFFQDVKDTIGYSGRLSFRKGTKCKIHDLMHDIALFVMGKECVTIVGKPSVNNKLLPNATRHAFLSVYDESPIFHTRKVTTPFGHLSKKETAMLQTFFITDYFGTLDISMYTSLRALHISAVRSLGQKHIAGQTHHLRYLNLSRHWLLTELPEEISLMHNLQTSDLSYCMNLRQLPKAMKYMNDAGTATDWVLPINEIISLRKKIKDIEHTISNSKNSPLLNKSSSSTPKDADKESSSINPLKNDAETRSSTQKEIDGLHRDIEHKVFGREKDREHISRMLHRPDANATSFRTSKPYSVMGIYGFTGSGKSTLARYVCDYEKGIEHFNPIMFIDVGKTFSIGDIFCDMLEEITQRRPPNDEGLKSLKTKMKKILRGKRFLLILDDLWVNDENQKERDILLDTLNVAFSGSRILVTAQNTEAGAALGAQKQISIHELNEEDYLSLFMHHARPATSDYDGEYRRIGSKIANRLCRSPIAAVTVGKQLQNKSISFWETAADLDVLDKTMGALWWSYQQLSVDIRRCFTYCIIFPKGYGLARDELVRIWVAQGFVKARRNEKEELEALGQRYFDQLLTFSFIQVRRITGRLGQEIVEFTIHDLLHELAERVCGSEFCSIYLKNGSTKEIPLGVRHLFIKTNNLSEIIGKIPDMRNLHTLIIKVKGTIQDFFEAKEPYEDEVSMETLKRNIGLEEEILERLFMRLTKLRTLILDQFRWVVSVPASIGQMKHLRYLGFVCNNCNAHLILPSTFSKLYHLQTIAIPCYRASCPEDMANLIHLRHISAPLSFPNIGRLKSLQRLERFVVKEEQGYGLKQLMHLNQIRGTLRIEDVGIVRRKEEALDAIKHKEGLRELLLRFDGYKPQFRKLEVKPDVEADVLEGLCPPKDIQELHIGDYRGTGYPTWMLSPHHPDAPKQLHRLELYFCSQLACIPKGSKLFISLRELYIYACDWDRLPENMEHLLSLQTLEILSCKKMELLPTLPQALKKIYILQCDKLRSIGNMDCPGLELKWEKGKLLEGCTSLEYCQDTAPTGAPEQSPYPMIFCPCLVTLEIRNCDNLVTIQNLARSLQNLTITNCGGLCSVSGQLGQLEQLHIYKCNKLQSVDSLGDASSLKRLFLSCCQCLASLGSGGGPGSYLALQQLRVEDCPAMDMKQFDKNVLDGLEEIKGIRCPDERLLVPWF